MDRTDEEAPKPPTTSPAPVIAQPLRVTPDNVVELAILFRRAADKLLLELADAEIPLRLDSAWMDDGASKWMQKFFNEYFLDGGNSFRNVLQAIYDQHAAHATALENAAALYGKTEELHAVQHAQLEGQLPG